MSAAILGAMNNNLTNKLYLDAMGIQVWQSRNPDPAEPAANVTPSAEDGVKSMPTDNEPNLEIDRAHADWGQLEEMVAACTACGLHQSRIQTVFGIGDTAARWVFVGEAPGADEDRQGEPFVGAAGKLLNAMLAALGLKREQVYIANVLKCRPPDNRDPKPEEVTHCESFLVRQIAMIQPAIIVTLGRHAAHSLIKTNQALGKLRGTKYDYHGIPLITTYHPAYLLRTPLDKRKAWEDLKLAKSIVEAT